MKFTFWICALQAAKQSILLSLVLLMAILLSSSMTVASKQMPTFATSTSMLNFFSSDHTIPRTINDPIMQTGTSIGLSFCAEAICESSHVKIKRIEDQDSILGFDIKSPRGWMEYIEKNEGNYHGVGAYTVIRCDAIYTKNKRRWKIWGLDFHMHRLCSSFRTLMENMSPETFDRHSWVDWEHGSTRRTDDVINALLNDAETSLTSMKTTAESRDNILENEGRVPTLMLTVLWTPAISDGKMQIIRGHATFAGSSHVWNPYEISLPSPISVCLAIPSNPSPEALSLLPRRHSEKERRQSSAKVSSWCRNRRPLEVLFRYSGVGEVVLMGEGKNTASVCGESFIDSLEMLEGLTSNLFVIYKDGSVRTAPATKVLSGYARHLVSEEIIQTHGLTLDDMNASVVGDAEDWSEVFLTSAIRLIIPVKQILIPPVSGADSVTLWESHDSGSNAHQFTELLWSGIHKKMKFLD